MVRGKNTKGLVLLVVVFWATPADSAPTLTIFDSTAKRCEQGSDSSTNIALVLNRADVTGPNKCHLISIQKEFHRPTVNYLSRTVQTDSIKSLPPGPRAFLLVLIGFLLISGVKDRKQWIAVMATLLIVGQSGFSFLPQLASHLCSRNRGSKCFYSLLHSSQPLIVPRLSSVKGRQVPASLEQFVNLLPVSIKIRRPAKSYKILCGQGDGVLKEEMKRQFPQTAHSAEICCFGYDSFFRIERARQFCIPSIYSVNSRLARGPPS